MKPEETLVHVSSLPVGEVLPAFEEEFGRSLTDLFSQMVRMGPYPKSITAPPGAICFLARDGVEKRLCVLSSGAKESPFFQEAEGHASTAAAGGDTYQVKVCELTHANALTLRKHIPFLRPRTAGLEKSIGLGDRLGLATPGHARAVAGTGVTPFFAQQSIREMERTHRTPDEVMDCASFGTLQEGFRAGFGSDADHLKQPEHIDYTAAAGFTMFTVDPGDHVDSDSDSDDDAALMKKYEGLPWSDLEISAADCRKLYVGRPMPGGIEAFGEKHLLRAAAKYGKAVAHTVKMYRHARTVMRRRPFELEMSVDETATPTTVYEHFYVAAELRRLGVRWVSLAPRFVGEFEKGVDYIGDIDYFRTEFEKHAAVMKALGPYKISVHSGSDKFAVYPVAAELADNLVHVKTAGTSYLEALRAISMIDPPLFREILAFAKERYPEDRATYHVSAEAERVPDPNDLKDADLPGLFEPDRIDAREVMHVTFGSVLTTKKPDGGWLFYDRFMAALRGDEEKYYGVLESHLGKHVAPFAD